MNATITFHPIVAMLMVLIIPFPKLCILIRVMANNPHNLASQCCNVDGSYSPISKVVYTYNGYRQ